jgi:hypothetical protein
MKKLMIVLGTAALLFSENVKTEQDLYLNYANKVINYEFTLKGLDKIKSPFYVKKIKKVYKSRNQYIKQNVQKVIKLELMSIFDNRAYIKIEEFLGEKLVSTNKKWIKKGDKVFGCKLVKLTETNAVFKCKNKTLNKTLNAKLPMLRDSK